MNLAALAVLQRLAQGVGLALAILAMVALLLLEASVVLGLSLAAWV